jgi:hypothetical protein
MSKVVYRGVEYDTTERPNQTFKIQPHVEIYRGAMFWVDENGNKLSNGKIQGRWEMKKLNFLQLIKEQKQKEERRHQAQLAQLVGAK